MECDVADFINCGCLPYAKNDDVLGVIEKLYDGTIGLTERKMWLARWRAPSKCSHASKAHHCYEADGGRTDHARQAETNSRFASPARQAQHMSNAVRCASRDHQGS